MIMKTNDEMNKKVKDTFDAMASIEEVKVSPFFKENVMHQIRQASEEVQEATGSWFTPQLQLVTLVAIVILNIMAFNSLKETTYDESLSSFAESYGLSTNLEMSIIN
ncbi:hypothetical protein DFQ08_103266 [Winogradskyella arenosi]|uniref:Uncharacterized protein n=2 Tax=Winogradskyella arenosi TaxID=533325 RepID=A0A368ZEV9_9FLAO|nr:hypothetical protein DFQ08_103266 [Winogradskyella arenosi]